MGGLYSLMKGSLSEAHTFDFIGIQFFGTFGTASNGSTVPPIVATTDKFFVCFFFCCFLLLRKFTPRKFSHPDNSVVYLVQHLFFRAPHFYTQQVHVLKGHDLRLQQCNFGCKMSFYCIKPRLLVLTDFWLSACHKSPYGHALRLVESI